jgi:hypothetical protein
MNTKKWVRAANRVWKRMKLNHALMELNSAVSGWHATEDDFRSYMHEAFDCVESTVKEEGRAFIENSADVFGNNWFQTLMFVCTFKRPRKPTSVDDERWEILKGWRQEMWRVGCDRGVFSAQTRMHVKKSEEIDLETDTRTPARIVLYELGDWLLVQQKDALNSSQYPYPHHVVTWVNHQIKTKPEWFVNPYIAQAGFGIVVLNDLMKNCSKEMLADPFPQVRNDLITLNAGHFTREQLSKLKGNSNKILDEDELLSQLVERHVFIREGYRRIPCLDKDWIASMHRSGAWSYQEIKEVCERLGNWMELCVKTSASPIAIQILELQDEEWLHGIEHLELKRVGNPPSASRKKKTL